MGILQKDIKLLWGRSANRCTICRVKLSQDTKSTNSSFPIGVQAHIVAESLEGPRGKSILSMEDRNSYHNLILLCPTHHTIVDTDVEGYPVEKLYIIKSRHEDWVENTLENENQDKQKEFLPITYLLYWMEEIKPFLFWRNRSIPADKAEIFLSRLQKFCMSSWIVGSIDLSDGIELLLRPISTGHYFNKQDRYYTRDKLSQASEQFSISFEKKGVQWNSIKPDSDPERIIHEMKWNILKIENEHDIFDADEINLVRLIQFIINYYESVRWEEKYISISESFVRHVNTIIDLFLKAELGFQLPDDFDGDENERLNSFFSNENLYDDDHNIYGDVLDDKDHGF